MSAGELPDALRELAVSFERDGYPIQAIHCLQALVNQPQSADQEATARLHLGRLLLEHSTSFEDAHKILLKAQLLANSLIGNYCLKYEVCNQLATCYRYMGKEAMELQVYMGVMDLWKAARGSNEWPVAIRWSCRMLQRATALHARCRRPGDAARCAAEGLALAEQHGLTEQRVVFLLLSAQLGLATWDHPRVDAALQALAELMGATQPAGGQGAPDPAALGLDARGYLLVLLHYNLLQVLYMLRQGRLTDVLKGAPEGAGAEGPEGEQLPPVLQHMLDTLQQLEGPGAPAGVLPYALPGLRTLEPLLSLVVVLALRSGTRGLRATEQHLQRGLVRCGALLAGLGLTDHGEDPDAAAGAPAALEGARLEAARPALRLEALLLGCKAQLLISRGQLEAARDVVLYLQDLLDTYHVALVAGEGGQPAAGGGGGGATAGGGGGPGLLPGVHLVTGQYCVATGEYGAAAAHFQAARQHAPSGAAAALAAVLSAEAVLSEHRGQPHMVTRAIQELGDFFTTSTSDPPGSRAERPPLLGHLEVAACQVASAACLAEQGHLEEANALLSRALKVAHRRLNHTQLTVTILNELIPTFLARADQNSTTEGVNSALTFSANMGDPWSEATAKHHLAAVYRTTGDEAKAGHATASARRREERVRGAVAAAAADAESHGAVVRWQLVEA